MSSDSCSVSMGQKTGWRRCLTSLTAQERARIQRLCGAILEVDLEALRLVLGVKTKICEINKNQCPLSMEKQSGIL